MSPKHYERLVWEALDVLHRVRPTPQVRERFRGVVRTYFLARTRRSPREVAERIVKLMAQ